MRIGITGTTGTCPEKRKGLKSTYAPRCGEKRKGKPVLRWLEKRPYTLRRRGKGVGWQRWTRRREEDHSVSALLWEGVCPLGERGGGNNLFPSPSHSEGEKKGKRGKGALLAFTDGRPATYPILGRKKKKRGRGETDGEPRLRRGRGKEKDLDSIEIGGMPAKLVIIGENKKGRGTGLEKKDCFWGPKRKGKEEMFLLLRIAALEAMAREKGGGGKNVAWGGWVEEKKGRKKDAIMRFEAAGHLVSHHFNQKVRKKG